MGSRHLSSHARQQGNAKEPGQGVPVPGSVSLLSPGEGLDTMLDARGVNIDRLASRLGEEEMLLKGPGEGPLNRPLL